VSWKVSQQGAVAIVAFDRPPENLTTFAALRELDDTLHRIADDESVSVVVITSDRPGYFVGRADRAELDRFARGQRGPDGFERWLWTLLTIETMPQPVVAAIDGQAWGGGCELALACTFRIGSRSAEFCQMEITKGAIPGAGATQRLPRLIGPARAARMILTGQIVRAEEALAIDLLDEIIDGSDFRTAALDWVDQIADKPRAALVAAKRALVEGQRVPLVEGLLNEQRLFLEVFTGQTKEA